MISRSSGWLCRNHNYCSIQNPRKSKGRASRIWNCGSRCLKIALAFCLNVLLKRICRKQRQHTSQTTMRRFEICVCLGVVIAAALASRDADAGVALVDMQTVDPTMAGELRYAGPNNKIGYAVYSGGRS